MIGSGGRARSQDWWQMLQRQGSRRAIGRKEISLIWKMLLRIDHLTRATDPVVLVGSASS